MFERFCLEAFQSGLSWLTILRKRENFRAAFLGFDMRQSPRSGPADVTRLLADPGIVRNRAKIEASIQNAKGRAGAARRLAALVWSYARTQDKAPVTLADVPAWTPTSKALSAQLKRHGFGLPPGNGYAAMQASGVVNDHLQACAFRGSAASLTISVGCPGPGRSAVPGRAVRLSGPCRSAVPAGPDRPHQIGADG